MDYCNQQHTLESVHFYLAIERYKSITDKKLRNVIAESIVNDFIRAESKYEVNCSDWLIAETHVIQIINSNNNDSISSSVFDPIQNEISQLICSAILPQFVQTEQFKLSCIFIQLHQQFLRGNNSTTQNITTTNYNNNKDKSSCNNQKDNSSVKSVTNNINHNKESSSVQFGPLVNHESVLPGIPSEII